MFLNVLLSAFVVGVLSYLFYSDMLVTPVSPEAGAEAAEAVLAAENGDPSPTPATRVEKTIATIETAKQVARKADSIIDENNRAYRELIEASSPGAGDKDGSGAR